MVRLIVICFIENHAIPAFAGRQVRKSFDGLCGLVRSGMNKDPMNGEVFIFINKRRSMFKFLHWESGGFVLYYKRLERGTFPIPELKEGDTVISWSGLVLMIEGIQIINSRQNHGLTAKKRLSFFIK